MSKSFWFSAAACAAIIIQEPAQVAAQSTPTETIRSIMVEGNKRIEDRTVESYLLVQPGDPFDADRIDLSLKTLFATGLFADAAFERRGNDLVVVVAENPIINRVIFEGNSSLDDEKLREEIQVAPRGIFTAARVQADVQRILELYRQSGRFAANVEPQYKPLDQNRVDLVFSIVEGPVTGVRAINFIGNEIYSDRRLRSEVVTRQSRWWRFFSANDNYDPGRLEYDRELLRQFYQNNGYYDFRVVSAVADLTPDQEDFYITYTIEEGDQYDFGTLKVESALDKLNTEALRGALGIEEGDLFRGDKIEKAIDTLTYAAGIAGYAFVDIKPDLEADPATNTVNVTFTVDEGPRVYIERINIVGNTRTLDQVVRRELRVSESDAFNRVLLDRSRNRVRALGYFKDVEITERPGSEADRVVVDLKVEEQPTGEMSFSAGYSSTESFLFDVGISERNLLGRGQTLSARVATSQLQNNVDLRFTEPRFLDRELAAGVSIFGSSTDYTDYGYYTSNTYGAGVQLGFPLSDNLQLGLRYTLQNDEIDIPNARFVLDTDTGERLTEEVTLDDNGTPDDPSDDVIGVDYVDPSSVPLPDGAVVVDQCDERYLSRSSLCRYERSEISSIVGYSLSLDQRGDPIAPRSGYDISLSQDFSGLGGDVNYVRTTGVANLYQGIYKDVVASVRLQGGYIEPFGSSDEQNGMSATQPQGIRINNRFFRGGSSFRGFDTAGLGPRLVQRIANDDGTVDLRRLDARGGKAFYQATLDLKLPNFLPEEYGIGTALFLEAGAVGLLDDVDQDDRIEFTDSLGRSGVQYVEDALTLRASTGLSVFWESPFGPIQFDFSHVLKREDYDRTESFRFSTSTRF